MSEAPVAPDWTEAGRKLFAGQCEFIFAAARSDGLPPVGPPEIAFAGRSNVGKSSLINALTGRAALDAAAVSYAVVLTKGDEVKTADQSARVAATLEGLRKHAAAYPEVLFTSARTGDGVSALRAHIARLIAEREGDHRPKRLGDASGPARPHTA
jgi:GTP-binding protein EngB required for normal cell division